MERAYRWQKGQVEEEAQPRQVEEEALPVEALLPAAPPTESRPRTVEEAPPTGALLPQPQLQLPRPPRR